MLTFLGAAGAFLLVLLAIFVIGRLWFALVETVKDAVMRRFFPGKERPWHPLPPEVEREDR